MSFAVHHKPKDSNSLQGTISMNIYCVYLTIYKGNKLPPFYIGSSSVEKVQKGYHGSVCSKQFRDIWKSEIRKNPNLFETKIISTHSDRKEATLRERDLQKKLSVVKNPLYTNQSFAAYDSFTDRDQSGKNNPMYGSSRRGIENPFYGQTHSDATKQKMRQHKNKRLEKLAKTLTSKYGVTNVRQLDSVKAKAAATNLEKYGFTNHMQTETARTNIANIRKENANRPIYLEVKQLYKKLGMKIPRGTYILSEEKLTVIRDKLANKF